MRIATAALLDRLPARILNLHPSLLPAFRGRNPQQQALDAGVRISGCTVHSRHHRTRRRTHRRSGRCDHRPSR
jgi:folate-dependent phosphoribosylglycinamide formyltransferase PurN